MSTSFEIDTIRQRVEQLCRFNCDAESSCRCAAHEMYRLVKEYDTALDSWQAAGVSGLEIIKLLKAEILSLRQARDTAEQLAIQRAQEIAELEDKVEAVDAERIALKQKLEKYESGFGHLEA